MVRIHDLATNEVIDREMNDAEFAQYEANQSAEAIKEEAKALIYNQQAQWFIGTYDNPDNPCNLTNIPNEYSVRYFIDVDGNELWNPIDFDKGIPAEEIYVFPEKINVRANWDLKVSLKLPV
jgi:hypothetical protein